MKTQNGFTLMNKNEIASYLAKQIGGDTMAKCGGGKKKKKGGR